VSFVTLENKISTNIAVEYHLILAIFCLGPM